MKAPCLRYGFVLIALGWFTCAPYRVLKSIKVPGGSIEYCVARDDTTEFIRLKGRADFREKENLSRENIKVTLNSLSRDLYKAASRLIQTECGNTTLTGAQAFDCLAEAADIFHYNQHPNNNGTIDIEAVITEDQLNRTIKCFGRLPGVRPAEPEVPVEREVFPKEQVRTKKAIDAVMTGRKEAVELCYQRQLRKGLHPRGTVVVTFTIETDGSVSNVGIGSSTVNSAELETCLTKVVATTIFKPVAPAAGSVTITYPFEFK